EESAEHPLGGEASHPHDVLDGGARTAEREAAARAARAARDRDDVQGDRRTEATVEPHPLGPEGLPALGGAEVEEREADGLLQLVDVRAREEDVRDVRLHVLDGLWTVRVEARIRERADDLVVPVVARSRHPTRAPAPGGATARSRP